MASITTPTFTSNQAINSSLSSVKTRSLQPNCLIGFGTRTDALSRVSLRRHSAFKYGSFIARCSLPGGNGSVVERTTLHDLYEKEGQSPWYDNLCRPVTDLLPLIHKGVRGVTSNPAIFQKAISTSDAYNDQFSELVKAGKGTEDAYWELVIKDIQDACKLFEPIFNQTDRRRLCLC